MVVMMTGAPGLRVQFPEPEASALLRALPVPSVVGILDECSWKE